MQYWFFYTFNDFTNKHGGDWEMAQVGKGGTAVFGCEDTRRATERFPLQTVVVPDTPVPPDSQFAWLNFPAAGARSSPASTTARWGQRTWTARSGHLAAGGKVGIWPRVGEVPWRERSRAARRQTSTRRRSS